MSLRKETRLTNGVDVKALTETCEAVKGKPELGQSLFRVHNTWDNGAHNRIEIKGYYTAGAEHTRSVPFRLEADEAPVLLGNDLGPNPVEYLLTALSGCMTTSIVYHAANRGIQIESLESDFKGTLDLRGFLGIGKDVPKGYQKIEVTFRIKTDATVEQIAELYQFSPVYSMVSKAVPVEVNITKT